MDRRNEPRFSISSPIKVTLLSSLEKQIDCRMIDISATGMRFVSDEPIPDDEVVAVDFDDHLAVTRVRNCLPYGGKFSIGTSRIHSLPKDELPQGEPQWRQIRVLLEEKGWSVELGLEDGGEFQSEPEPEPVLATELPGASEAIEALTPPPAARPATAPAESILNVQPVVNAESLLDAEVLDAEVPDATVPDAEMPDAKASADASPAMEAEAFISRESVVDEESSIESEQAPLPEEERAPPILVQVPMVEEAVQPPIPAPLPPMPPRPMAAPRPIPTLPPMPPPKSKRGAVVAAGAIALAILGLLYVMQTRQRTVPAVKPLVVDAPEQATPDAKTTPIPIQATASVVGPSAVTPPGAKPAPVVTATPAPAPAAKPAPAVASTPATQPVAKPAAPPVPAQTKPAPVVASPPAVAKSATPAPAPITKPVPQPAVAKPTPATTAAAPVLTAGAHSVRLTVLQACWITVTADGKPVLSKVVEKGSQDFPFAKFAFVHLGNSRSAEISLDGATIPAAPGTGALRLVQLTASGAKNIPWSNGDPTAPR